MPHYTLSDGFVPEGHLKLAQRFIAGNTDGWPTSSEVGDMNGLPIRVPHG